MFSESESLYDGKRHAVGFWGHDGAIEVSFFVNEDALQQIQPGVRRDEAGLLGAFDLHRDFICATAAKVYGRGHRGSYELLRVDFEVNMCTGRHRSSERDSWTR